MEMTVKEAYDSLSPCQRDLLSFFITMAIEEDKNKYRKLDLCPECMKKISSFYVDTGKVYKGDHIKVVIKEEMK